MIGDEKGNLHTRIRNERTRHDCFLIGQLRMVNGELKLGKLTTFSEENPTMEYKESDPFILVTVLQTSSWDDYGHARSLMMSLINSQYPWLLPSILWRD